MVAFSKEEGTVVAAGYVGSLAETRWGKDEGGSET